MKRVLAIGLAVIVGGGGVAWLTKVLIDFHRSRVEYRLTEVCSPCFHGTALNNEGQVAGALRFPGATRGSKWRVHAAIWALGGGATDLGTFGGIESQAQDLNDAGRVVGIAHLQPVQTAYYGERRPSDGFLWKRGTRLKRLLRLIGTRRVEGISPVGINNRDQVVGCATFRGNEGYHAFFWDPKHGVQDLGTLGGKYSCAVDLNDQGQVIGNSDIQNGSPDGPSHAFLWEQGKGMQDLGTLGGPNSFARGINNAGQIVGSSNRDDGLLHAFLWEHRVGLKDLGTLGGAMSTATGINDKGVVVGDSAVQGAQDSEPFLWQKERGMRSLHDLIDPDDPLKKRVVLRVPRAINNTGQILVDAQGPSPKRAYSVLLSPVQDQ